MSLRSKEPIKVLIVDDSTSARTMLRRIVESDQSLTVLGAAGDAFAAGVLHAHLRGDNADAMAATGLALTCLKHALPGDASLFRQADIDAFHDGGLDVRR